MAKNLIYTGLSIDYDELISKLYESNPSIKGLERLEKPKTEFHVTLRFRPNPDEVLDDIFGAEVRIRVIGYGRSLDNEGLCVELYPVEESLPIHVGHQASYIQLNDILRSIETPHITLSTSSTGLAKNTKDLTFWSLVKPFFVTGVYTGFDGKGRPVNPEAETKEVK